jgi:hypothetical protein
MPQGTFTVGRDPEPLAMKQELAVRDRRAPNVAQGLVPGYEASEAIEEDLGDCPFERRREEQRWLQLEQPNSSRR